MADTVIGGSSGDAKIYPSDEGIAGVSDGSEDWDSAGLAMLLAGMVNGGSYVRSSSELTFTNHDGTNDTVDVTAGVAFLDLAGETVNVQTSYGGSSPATYDTALPTLPTLMVWLPTNATGVSLQDSTLSDVWLAYDTDGTGPGSAGDVYIRSDDTGGVSAPSHPNVKIGEANPDNASADVLTNRGSGPTFNALDLSDAAADPSANGQVRLNGSTVKIQSDETVRSLTAPTFEDVTIADLLTLQDATTAPTANGEFRLDGADVKVQTGGVVRNLTNTQNDPPWTPDTNSPFTATGGSSANSINPSSLDTFDTYLVFVKATDQASSGNNMDLHVGGDTGANYNEVTVTGTRNTGQSEWGPITRLAPSATAGIWFRLYENIGSMGFTNLTADGSTSVIHTGDNTNVTFPPGQFTLSRGADTDWEVRVWGADI